MIRGLRWLVPPACMALSLYPLRLSYRTYVKWQEYIALGDTSGAEIPETEFWLEVSIGLLLIVLAAFLAGRWSVIGRHDGSE